MKSRHIDTQAIMMRKQKHMLIIMIHHDAMEARLQAKHEKEAETQTKIIRFTHQMQRLDASQITAEQIWIILDQTSAIVQQLTEEIIVLER